MYNRRDSFGVVGDVADPESWERARACLHGVPPKWLVQCAGIAVTGAIADAPIEHWRRAIEVNLLGLVLGCRTFVPGMAEEGGGHIVHIASRAAISGVPQVGPYAASKAAVVAMSETLYNEVGDRVTVTVACPSYFQSNLAKEMVACRDIERRILRHRIETSPRTADDMARAVIEAARRGALYFFPPGEDRRFWLRKRLKPTRALRSIRDRFRSAVRAMSEEQERR